jgi:hypothetical protein
MRPPKFLTLYRRLLGNNGNFWTGARQGHDDSYGLRMDSLTGCPDDVMLAIAEVSALAHWKAQEKQNGCLSMRELIRRGDAIEQQLRTHTEPESFAEVDQAPMHPSLPGMNIDYTRSSAQSALPSSQSVDTTMQFPSEEMRRVVAGLFRETVVLYLHTVLSESIPGTYYPFFSGQLCRTHIFVPICRSARDYLLCGCDHQTIESFATVRSRSFAGIPTMPHRLPD